jgi:hypothetical protein
MSKQNSYKFSPEDFVRAWETSSSTKEVSNKLSAICGRDVPVHLISARASKYRARGVRLKYMKGGRESLDVELLNQVMRDAKGVALSES